MSKYFHPCPKEEINRDAKYRLFVADQGCVIQDCSDQAVAHHVTEDKSAKGTAVKTHDKDCVGLCVKHHSEHDHMGQKSFWKKYNLNPKEIIQDLRSLYERI